MLVEFKADRVVNNSDHVVKVGFSVNDDGRAAIAVCTVKDGLLNEYYELTYGRTVVLAAPPEYKLISIYTEAADPEDIEDIFDNEAILEMAMGAIKSHLPRKLN
jgi:hypothetical protein